MTSRQAHSAPPVTPDVAPRRAAVRSRWPDWVGPAAAVWSLGYGLLGLHWTLGGAGFPFGTEHDPYTARVSILEHVQQRPAAPVLTALGLGGAALAMVLARRRTRGPVGAALLGFAWTMAVALTVVIPDVRPLTGVARTPIVLVGLPFGWPEGVTLPSLFPWPVVNQFLLIGGGLLCAAAGVAYQRRVGNACGHCRRSDATTGWTTPASAARWGRWATAIAVTVPVLYAATRWAWALGIPLRVTREFLREGGPRHARHLAGRRRPRHPGGRRRDPHPGPRPALGRGLPPLDPAPGRQAGPAAHRHHPGVAGRGPDDLGRAGALPRCGARLLPEGSTGQNWGTVAPGYLWPLWGIALGAATYAYHPRRRGRCPYCGRPDPSGR